jgi:two-component system sensor histidine kinase KdpD
VSRVPERPDPEQLLRRLENEEQSRREGRLKVFLGYTSGVGKTPRMLHEAKRRWERGEDLIIAALPAALPDELRLIAATMPSIPPLSPGGAIDVSRLLARKPEVVVVDPLALDNPEGSRNRSRWQDLLELLSQGISVLTAVNIQYIDELKEQTSLTSGKVATMTVPRRFIERADEIEVVDVPPEWLSQRRLKRPDEVWDSERIRRLTDLREAALLLAAEVVDQQLDHYLERHGLQASPRTYERILVCLTPRSSAAEMLEVAVRNRDRYKGELHVIYVRQPGLTPAQKAALESNFELARAAAASVHIANETDPVEAISAFARTHGITQVFIGHTSQHGWWNALRGTPVDRLIGRGAEFDINIFPL